MSETELTTLDLTDPACRADVHDVLERVVAGHYRTTNAGMTSTVGWLAPWEKAPLHDLYRAGMVTYEPTVRLTASGLELASSLGVDAEAEVHP